MHADPSEAQPQPAPELQRRTSRWRWALAAATIVVCALAFWGYVELAAGASGGAVELAASQADLEPTLTDASLRALRQNGEIVEKGARVFDINCASCHGAKGAGSVGPNLTDRNWLHGGTPRAIFTSVAHGIPIKGMPAWQAALGPEGVRQVTAFVLSLRNTQLAGKPAQGDEYTGD